MQWNIKEQWKKNMQRYRDTWIGLRPGKILLYGKPLQIIFFLYRHKINQFWSISSSGRTYPLKIPHGRVRILYKSIHNYSSIQDNTFLKERGMLGSYNTSDYPITIVVVSLINIVVPLLSPYFYYCAP